MWEKGKYSFTEVCQQINIEQGVKLETHFLTTITGITISDKNHQKRLYVTHDQKHEEKQDIYIASKDLLTDD